MSSNELPSDDAIQESDYDGGSDSTPYSHALQPFVPFNVITSGSPRKLRHHPVRRPSPYPEHSGSSTNGLSNYLLPSSSNSMTTTTSSDEGHYYSGRQILYGPGSQKEHIRQFERLEEENRKLRQKNLVLQTEVSTIRDLYQSLTQSLPGILATAVQNQTQSSFPSRSTSSNPFIAQNSSASLPTHMPTSGSFSDQPLRLRSDYPHVRFWHRKDWIEQKKENLGITQVTQSLPSKQNKARGSHNSNVSLRYIEDQFGVVIDGFRASEMCKFARSIWSQLAAAGKAPKSWGKADLDVAGHYRREMLRRFPELGLCEFDWKAEQLATDNYPNWASNNLQDVKEEPSSTHIAKRRRDSAGHISKRARIEKSRSPQPPAGVASIQVPFSNSPPTSTQLPTASCSDGYMPTKSTGMIPVSSNNSSASVPTITLSLSTTMPSLIVDMESDPALLSLAGCSTSRGCSTAASNDAIVDKPLSSSSNTAPTLSVQEIISDDLAPASPITLSLMSSGQASNIMADTLPDSMKPAEVPQERNVVEDSSIATAIESHNASRSEGKMPPVTNPLSLQPLSMTIADKFENFGHCNQSTEPPAPPSPTPASTVVPINGAGSIPTSITEAQDTFPSGTSNNGMDSSGAGEASAVGPSLTNPTLNISHTSDAMTKKLGSSKRPGKMRPGSSRTARNLCAQDWIQANPLGTTAEFKIHFDNLSAQEKKLYLFV